MSEKTKISVQIGSLPTLLTVAFVVLKLCNVITWSWWWVTSPLWIPLGLLLLIFIGMVIVTVISHRRFTKRKKTS